MEVYGCVCLPNSEVDLDASCVGGAHHHNHHHSDHDDKDCNNKQAKWAVMMMIDDDEKVFCKRQKLKVTQPLIG